MAVARANHGEDSTKSKSGSGRADLATWLATQFLPVRWAASGHNRLSCPFYLSFLTGFRLRIMIEAAGCVARTNCHGPIGEVPYGRTRVDPSGRAGRSGRVGRDLETCDGRRRAGV